MLLYVIPFVLLLVVAIVLKKREDANKENTNTTSKKTNNKKSSKKNVARTARTSQKQQRTAVVENEVVVQQATKPLSPELKSSIEKLIAAKNYFSAEAKINQALNQDNAQHELYLYLLDVHLAQKDEFAVNQLINHIRSLGLDDIVAQAEEKKKATQTESTIESIAFVPTTPEPAVPEVKNTAAFDALIGNIETTPTPSTANLETPTRNDVETLDFTPSVAQEKSEEKPQAQALEFNLDSSPQTQTEPLVEFSFETLKPTTETAKETITPLEFSFTPNEPIVAPVEKPVEIEIAPEFKLDFAEPVATPEKEQTAAPQAFEFKLTPTEAETPVETQPTFVFDQETKSESVEPESVASQLNLEVPSQVEAVTPVETTDPLLTSFPELAQVNEIQLNLDLAQQYIHLGAYASARALLSQHESVYTAEQRQQSQNLLNQIA
ncbi:hypothetical protein [Acinetobacter bereziniae]|uniref:hypothetical protein n=1 Tax=Acinetobacter bereziniae TaxID=106648 RepID=UPI0018DBFFFF|nr:hypothetical protein [Acinetobacter bereziniae]MBI0396042.1 hypothetical protein [Acinetobacter bereziniae]